MEVAEVLPPKLISPYGSAVGAPPNGSGVQTTEAKAEPTRVSPQGAFSTLQSHQEGAADTPSTPQRLFLAAGTALSLPTNGKGNRCCRRRTVTALFTAQPLTLHFTKYEVGDHYNPLFPWGHKESMNKS